MRFAKKFSLTAVGLILASWMSACGSGSSTALPANIRVVNLNPTANDSVTLELNVTEYGVAAGAAAASGYIQVVAGVYEGQVVDNNPSISSTPFPGLGLGQSGFYSILSYPREGVLYPYELVDNVGVPGAGAAQLSIANASPDAGPLDVYYFAHTSASPADPCTNALVTAQFASVQGQQSPAQQIPTVDASGNQASWDICVTGAGAPGDVRFSTTTPIQFLSTQIYALVLTSSSGGTLVDGALVIQNGGVSVLPNSSFRLRVLAAQSTNPAAVVTVGTTTLPTVTSGNYTPYVTVPLGTTQPAVTVTVGGSTIPLTVPTGFTFAEGADYSILVYGTSTVAATLLVDNNHYKSQSASVRLVNAADSQNLSLYVNGEAELLVATPLAAASAYVGINQNDLSQALVKVSSSDIGSSSPSGAPVSWNFVVGDVYTVFLYDITQPPIIITDKIN